MDGAALVTKALRIVAVLAPVLLSASAARADAITYRFSGVGHAKPTEAQSWGFDPIPDDVPIPFSGTFSYDPKLPALGGGDGVAAYGYNGSTATGPGDPAFNVHLEVGGKTVYDGSNAGPGGLLVYYHPAVADTGDGYSDPGSQGILLSSWPGNDSQTGFSIYLGSSASSLFTSTDLEALPDLGPVLGAGGWANMDFFSPDAIPDSGGVYGDLTSLERQSVPEPSTLVVIGAGALVLALRRRRAGSGPASPGR